MAKAKKKGKKTGSRPTRGQTIDLTLRLNVELERGKGKQKPRRERVKRVTSRKRQNLREMRQSLPGTGGPQAFANPAFYGNVKMLNNAALNQFQNQRYSLEQQVRESSAKQKALLAPGRAEAAQQAAQALATQAQVLAFRDPDETAELVDQFKATHRAQGRTERREKQVQALRLQAKKGEGTPKKAVRGYGSDEEEEEEFYSDPDD